MKRKILAIVLTLCMVVSLLPTVALADGVGTATLVSEIKVGDQTVSGYGEGESTQIATAVTGSVTVSATKDTTLVVTTTEAVTEVKYLVKNDDQNPTEEQIDQTTTEASGSGNKTWTSGALTLQTGNSNHIWIKVVEGSSQTQYLNITVTNTTASIADPTVTGETTLQADKAGGTITLTAVGGAFNSSAQASSFSLSDTQLTVSSVEVNTTATLTITGTPTQAGELTVTVDKSAFEPAASEDVKATVTVAAAAVVAPEAPTFSSETATFESAEATTVTFTLTNGPASSYKVYGEETGGEALGDPTAKVSSSTLTLTFTTKPEEAKSYYIAADNDGTESESRTKVTVNPYVAPAEAKLSAEPAVISTEDNDPEITVSIADGTFVTEQLTTGNVEISGATGLTVSEVTNAADTSFKLKLTGKASNEGTMTITVKRAAITDGSKDLTVDVTVSTGVTVSPGDVIIPVGEQNPEIQLTASANFAETVDASLVTIVSGGDGLSVASVTTENTTATIKFSGAASEAGTMQLKFDKTAFETEAPNDPTVDIPVKDRTKTPTFDPATVTATDGNKKAVVTVSNSTDYQDKTITVKVYTDQQGTSEAEGVSGSYAEGTLTLNITTPIEEQTTYYVTFEAEGEPVSEVSGAITVDPAEAKLTKLIVNGQEVTVGEAGDSSSPAALSVTLEKYAENFTITANFAEGTTAKYSTTSADDAKTNGTALTDGAGSGLIQFESAETKEVYIYVGNEGVEGYYKLTVTNGTPTATLTATLNGDPLKKGVEISGQTIVLTLGQESTAKFKTSGLQTTDFSISGTGATGITIESVESAGGNSATLTLSGTPTAAGTVTVTAQTSAFDPAPTAAVEATGDINVIDAEKTSTPTFANSTVNCEKGNTTAVFTVTNPSAFEGEVTVEVKKDGEAAEGVTAKYEAGTLTLTFETALTTDNNAYTVTFTDGSKEPSEEVTLTVNRYVPEAPEFESAEATFESAEATSVTFTLTNGPASGYKVYSQQSEGEAATGVEASVEGTTLTLNFTAQPEETTKYYVAAVESDVESATRTEVTVNPYKAPTVTLEVEGTLQAGKEGGTLTLTATGAKFADSADTANFTITSEDELTVSEVTVGEDGTTATVTVTGTPSQAGSVSLTVKKEAFEPEAAADASATVTVDAAPTVTLTGETTLQAGTEGGTITLTADGSAFADPAETSNFTLSDETLTVSEVTVNEDGTATLTVTGTPAEAAELTVTVSAAAFTPNASAEATATVTVAAAETTATPTPTVSGETYTITAEDGNETAVLPLSNSYEGEEVTVSVYTEEGTKAEGVTGSYSNEGEESKITLSFDPALEAETTYQISVTEDGKNESQKITVKVQLHPVTADPEFRSDSVIAEADNLSAKFVVENAEDYTGEIAVVVYDSEGTNVAEGVTGNYADGVLTLTFTEKLSEARASYQVTFQNGTDTVSGKVTVSVDPFKATTPTPVPAIEGEVTVACTTSANTTAALEVTNWQDYNSETVTVTVYDESGEQQAENVTGSYDAKTHVITLTASSGTLPGTYQVTMTNKDMGESEKLKVVVTNYEASAAAELTDFTGSADQTTYEAMVYGDETGADVADAIHLHFNITSETNISSISFKVPTGATVTYLASSTQLLTDDQYTGEQTLTAEEGAATISSVDFSSNAYLYIKSVSEDESETLYYVITVNKIDVKAGDAETETEIPAEYETALSSLGQTAIAEDSADTVTNAILDAIATDSQLMEKIAEPGDSNSPANDGTVWGALKYDNPAASGTLTFYYIPEISVTVADGGYDANAKTLTVDITPTYSVIATTASSLEQAKFKGDSGVQIAEINAVVVAADQTLNLQNVEVTIPIPTSIASDNAIVYVQHDGSWGAYKVTSNAVTLTVPHFSEFVISAESQGAALIGSTVYATVQDAINAVKDGETISLTDKVSKADLKNLTPPTSGVTNFTIEGGTSGLTLQSGDVTFLSKTSGGYDYSATVSYNQGKATVTVTWTKVYTVTVSTSGSGSMTADKTTAKTGETVTLTVASGTLESVTAQTKGGTTVNITKGTGNYTFVMPDDDVTVTATFKTSTPTPGPRPSGPSGPSISSDPTVNSATAINGSFAISDKNAKAGDTVKVTPTAASGFVVDEVTVTDKNGNNITVTQNADGTYSFVMPAKSAQPVTVEVTFICDGGDNCLTKDYTDVDQSAWYHKYVDYVVERKLMLGVAPDVFSPEGTATRAELVTVLWRLDGSPVVEKNVFTDVPESEWFAAPIAWAASHDIVGGYGDGKFGPDDSVTREQMVAILYRYASYKGYDVTKLAELTGYTDADSIEDWAVPAMRWAVANDIIEGTTTTTLEPSGNSERAQIAAVLMRFIEDYVK